MPRALITLSGQSWERGMVLYKGMPFLFSAHKHAWDSSTPALLSTYNRVYSMGSVN